MKLLRKRPVNVLRIRPRTPKEAREAREATLHFKSPLYPTLD